ncbi:NADP-dependent oxidoreductase [Spiractinospora alimapuensis]|uniref:NADP-dependent oxidoreductase n=1 Tax=Spiractinospora alimapuensis TaxID=2820884 RepID=UPI001F2236CC|nr:NADP-dependent oxidoreductase [Spiractinospora alimapuensis]QVQ52630.1 NADP-dependent oxidoreductase [Spiractinospora alimapuensis]
MVFTSREIQLRSRPRGEPSDDDFATVTVEVPDPGPGQVVVANDWLSVDPYMRGRMDDVESYISPFALGETMTGGAVGTVVASDTPDLPTGTVVRHFLGWREHALLDAGQVEVLDTAIAPASAYLGVLGTTGLTAYVGLTEIARVDPGDTVFVSAASGAVGSVIPRIARHLGAKRVVGSAGGARKVRRAMEDFGYDAAVDYKEGTLLEDLRLAAPDGVDVYFDNVGGTHLQAALDVVRPNGRVALCGAVAHYNAEGRGPGPDNLYQAIKKRLTLRGFIIGDHRHLAAEYTQLAAGWLADGSLTREETVTTGIDTAVSAFLDILKGGNTGKTLIHLPRT